MLSCHNLMLYWWQILFGILYIVNLGMVLLIYLKTDVVCNLILMKWTVSHHSRCFTFRLCLAASLVGSLLAFFVKETAFNLCASLVQWLFCHNIVPCSTCFISLSEVASRSNHFQVAFSDWMDFYFRLVINAFASKVIILYWWMYLLPKGALDVLPVSTVGLSQWRWMFFFLHLRCYSSCWRWVDSDCSHLHKNSKWHFHLKKLLTLGQTMVNRLWMFLGLCLLVQVRP